MLILTVGQRYLTRIHSSPPTHSSLKYDFLISIPDQVLAVSRDGEVALLKSPGRKVVDGTVCHVTIRDGKVGVLVSEFVQQVVSDRDAMLIRDLQRELERLPLESR